jgi:hypothetical protein
LDAAAAEAAPKPEDDLARDDLGEFDDAAVRSKRLGQVMRDIAKQAALDPGDDLGV